MLSTILSWIYIFILCMLIGTGILSPFKNRRFSFIYNLIAGIIGITVYVEIFSIFGKIGAAAHLILLGTALIIGYIKRKELKEIWKNSRPVICSWEGFFYCGFILLLAFFTSRGEFHTDTNIYHGAAIRIYEEYG